MLCHFYTFVGIQKYPHTDSHSAVTHFGLYWLFMLLRVTAGDSDKSQLDLHGLSTAEALHVLETTLSTHQASMSIIVVVIIVNYITTFRVPYYYATHGGL